MKTLVWAMAALMLLACGCSVHRGPMSVEEMISNCNLPIDDVGCDIIDQEGLCAKFGDAVSGKNFATAHDCRKACFEVQNHSLTEMHGMTCVPYVDHAGNWCNEYCNSNFPD